MLEKKVERLLRVFEAGAITDEELWYNLKVTLIGNATESPRYAEGWRNCLAKLSHEKAVEFEAWLRRETETCDYMPDPGAFLLNFHDAEEIERTKREHRQFHVELHDRLRERLRASEL